METNPYKAPETHVADMVTEDGALASRGERFLAALVDGVIMLAIVLPIMFMTGYFQLAAAGEVGLGTTLGYAAMGFVLFALVQGYPLSQTAQTWGKRVLGIRIQSLDGTQPTLGTLLLKRYLPVQAIGNVPLVGPIFGIVNILFIFRADKRCIHDLIAGTRVVKA